MFQGHLLDGDGSGCEGLRKPPGVLARAHSLLTFLVAIFPLQVRTAAIRPKKERTVLPSQRSKMKVLKKKNGIRRGWTAFEVTARRRKNNGRQRVDGEQS